MSTMEKVQQQEEILKAAEDAAFALKDAIAAHQSLTHEKQPTENLRIALERAQRQVTIEQTKLVRIRAQWKIRNSTE